LTYNGKLLPFKKALDKFIGDKDKVAEN